MDIERENLSTRRSPSFLWWIVLDDEEYEKRTSKQQAIRTLSQRLSEPCPQLHNERRCSAALSGVMSRCGMPSISNPTINLRIVADRRSGG